MIEGAIVFVLGYICGIYKDSIKNFFDSKFKNNESKEQLICD